MKLIGYYNEEGYTISCGDGPDLYTASNHKQDSGQHAAPGSPEAMSLEEIKCCCRHTLEALCQELSARYGGLEYIED